MPSWMTTSTTQLETTSISQPTMLFTLMTNRKRTRRLYQCPKSNPKKNHRRHQNSLTNQSPKSQSSPNRSIQRGLSCTTHIEIGMLHQSTTGSHQDITTPQNRVNCLMTLVWTEREETFTHLPPLEAAMTLLSLRARHPRSGAPLQAPQLSQSGQVN